jgi:hypothetical protein
MYNSIQYKKTFHRKTAFQRQIEATDKQIDHLVYQFTCRSFFSEGRLFSYLHTQAALYNTGRNLCQEFILELDIYLSTRSSFSFLANNSSLLST